MTQLSDKALAIVTKKYENDNKGRLNHILGVKDMAIKLSKIYNADVEKAKIAALMHDYYKYEDYITLAKLINEEDKEECQSCNVLYHSYASANAYLNMIGNDMDIYNAIRNHVFGRVNASLLEEIILISDYTEENRSYPDCISCRNILFKDGLYEAIYDSTLKTINHLVNKGIEPHKNQYLVLEYYDKKRKK